ncbi:hypothetical protein DSO57_1003940 [Entomophthora muscae]|uniref:Uncharacterized protein n=1 Tax=Entomophthora muscae TaxID=34485 RepID=A0ACC2RZA9_9FUNG|nr:hypothetical protein DSO57_1003940 [Entomophthora muscae]
MTNHCSISFLLNPSSEAPARSFRPPHILPKQAPTQQSTYGMEECLQIINGKSSPQTEVKPKRKRANSLQIKVLEQVFRLTCFPSTHIRTQLGLQLGMTPRTVQIWFQNKRQSLDIRRHMRPRPVQLPPSAPFFPAPIRPSDIHGILFGLSINTRSSCLAKAS